VSSGPPYIQVRLLGSITFYVTRGHTNLHVEYFHWYLNKFDIKHKVCVLLALKHQPNTEQKLARTPENILRTPRLW
jgi:hypothetical protein